MRLSEACTALCRDQCQSAKTDHHHSWPYTDPDVAIQLPAPALTNILPHLRFSTAITQSSHPHLHLHPKPHSHSLHRHTTLLPAQSALDHSIPARAADLPHICCRPRDATRSDPPLTTNLPLPCLHCLPRPTALNPHLVYIVVLGSTPVARVIDHPSLPRARVCQHGRRGLDLVHIYIDWCGRSGLNGTSTAFPALSSTLSSTRSQHHHKSRVRAFISTDLGLDRHGEE